MSNHLERARKKNNFRNVSVLDMGMDLNTENEMLADTVTVKRLEQIKTNVYQTMSESASSNQMQSKVKPRNSEAVFPLLSVMNWLSPPSVEGCHIAGNPFFLCHCNSSRVQTINHLRRQTPN